MPRDVLGELEEVLLARRAGAPEGSYSATLLGDGERAQRKIMEEAFELCLELGRVERGEGAAERAVAEAADLLFHVLAGLVGSGVRVADVLDELARRRDAAGAGEGKRT